MIGIIHHPDFLLHDTNFPRPHFESFETPERLAAIYTYLQQKDIFELPEIIESILAKPIKEKDLYKVHAPYLVDSVRSLSKIGEGEIGTHSFASRDAFDVAKLAAGGTILACEKVLKGNVDQSFALIRPPGHHAGYSKTEGLCIFNNCAAAVLTLKRKKKLDRTLIIDLDSHHGDGIAEFFYSDPSVMYISIHEFNEADKGDVFEIGFGEGEGYNVNIPLPFFTLNRTYLKSFQKIVPPLAKEFNPEFIIVAMGFDTHYADPVGNLRLTSQSYAMITRQLKELAELVCDGKLVFVLEGGYNLLGLPRFVEIVIKALLDHKIEFFDDLPFEEIHTDRDAIKRVNLLKNVLSKFWKCF